MKPRRYVKREILYISQPVTQRLKAIEHSFGVGIFIRTKKQLITTTEGAMIRARS